MYDKRAKIFVIVSALFLLICVLRLFQMQLLPNSRVQDDIAELKRQRGLYQQLKTIRGKILDRTGRILAVDEPRFHLYIDYRLSSFLDQRVQQALLLAATDNDNSKANSNHLQEKLQAKLECLRQVMEKCTRFGLSQDYIETRIKEINDNIWNLREYLAWKRNYPNRDLEEAVRDPNDRIRLIAKVDIAEMYKSHPLFELKTDDDIFTAQLEFMDVEGIEILPMGHRFYPYGSVAAQTIGWVGPATQEQDKRLFENDRLASYLDGEVCGREDGVEYICEAILRGRRGELIYDIDRQLIGQTETQFGKDVQLTLDIELQKRIEEYLCDEWLNPNFKSPTAAVVIDVATGDILALISLPAFDLNRARYEYSKFAGDPNKPLINRAINKHYPPGSVVKPLILIAGLESNQITPDEIIGCPAESAPAGWPSCWIYNQHRTGHNTWPNNARNAIRGSCNIYFSRLADRIEPVILQQWLFKFGYGRVSSLELRATGHRSRDLRQAPGQISTILVSGTKIISSFEQIPPLSEVERRLFGIGQGNLRATPLQVANAMAAIARRGILKPPRLFFSSVIASEAKQSQTKNLKLKTQNSDDISLGISEETLAIVYDGMRAVVSEPGGTAYNEFANSGLSEQGIIVYGKTGSTEEPDNAWFGGFARDSTERSVAIAVVVEGGQHGSRDAAPLARDIIQFCIEAGYIGNPQF